MPCYKILPRDGRPIDPMRFVETYSKFVCLNDVAPLYFDLCEAIAPGVEDLVNDVNLAIEYPYGYIEKYREAEDCTSNGLPLDAIQRWMERESMLGMLDYKFSRDDLELIAVTKLRIARKDFRQVVGLHEFVDREALENALKQFGRYLSALGDELGDFSLGDSFDLFRFPADRMARVSEIFAELGSHDYRVWK
jgi:hypothetical protein